MCKQDVSKSFEHQIKHVLMEHWFHRYGVQLIENLSALGPVESGACGGR